MRGDERPDPWSTAASLLAAQAADTEALLVSQRRELHRLASRGAPTAPAAWDEDRAAQAAGRALWEAMQWGPGATARALAAALRMCLREHPADAGAAGVDRAERDWLGWVVGFAKDAMPALEKLAMLEDEADSGYGRFELTQLILEASARLARPG